MRAAVLAIASLGACQVTPQDGPVPWLYGMSSFVAADRASRSATQLLQEHSTPEPDCAAGAYQAVELVADVLPRAGSETVLASYANGVVVLDGERHLVASTAGYRCEGSADEIEIVGSGHAYGDQTLVVVGKNGGHREYATWVGLFRVGDDKRLDAVFTATVEEHRGSNVRKGALYMLPGSLIYQSPGGKPALHVYDPVGRAYLVPGELIDESDHDGPTIRIEDVHQISSLERHGH
jgi:hypothetical protein